MRAAIYARVSTPRQARDRKTDQQVARLEQHAERQGWVLGGGRVYLDEGYSGASLNRPGLDALRDAAAMAEFEVVLVSAPDRLARKYVHQVLLLEELQGHGCRVEFLERPMSQDPNDQLLLQIRGAVAEYERTLIAERMRRGRLAKLRSGQLLPWMRVPFGYRTDVRLVPGAGSNLGRRRPKARGSGRAHPHGQDLLVQKHHTGHPQELRLHRQRLRPLHPTGTGEGQKIAA